MRILLTEGSDKYMNQNKTVHILIKSHTDNFKIVTLRITKVKRDQLGPKEITSCLTQLVDQLHMRIPSKIMFPL